MQDLTFVLGIFTVVFLGLGIPFLLIGLLRSLKVKKWHHTKGEIIKKEVHISINLLKIINNEEFRERDTPDDRPTVQFEVNGIKYEHTSNISQNPPSLYPGQEVNVLFNPANPEEAMINTFIQRGHIFTVIGASLSAIALIIFGIGIVYQFFL